jgi:hypothetical protein
MQMMMHGNSISQGAGEQNLAFMNVCHIVNARRIGVSVEPSSFRHNHRS